MADFYEISIKIYAKISEAYHSLENVDIRSVL